MPELTRAPDRRPPTASSPRPPARGPRSMERTYRQRRTIATAALVILLVIGWYAVRSVFGDAAPTATGAASTGVLNAPGTTSAAAGSTTPSSDKSSAASRSKTSPTAAEPTSVPQHGTGKIAGVVIPGADTQTTGRVVTFDVEAEGGLGVDLDHFAAEVRRILSDKRGWETKDGVHFVAVSAQQRAAGKHVDVRVTLASPDLTDQLCAPLRTGGEVSCNQNGRAVINAERWVKGVPYYKDLDLYRTYLINHEVGHGLGHSHQLCPAKGQRAPIMVQQTLGLQGCTAWPYPVGA